MHLCKQSAMLMVTCYHKKDDIMALTTSEKTARYRDKMRAAGLRPIQVWVPDTRSRALAEEARRQSWLVSKADESDLMDELEAAAAETEAWEW